MRLNTLRKSISNYFDKNKLKYFSLLLVLIAGLTAGILFACSVDYADSAEIVKSLNSTFSKPDNSRIEIFLGFFQKNLKCIMAVLMTTLTAYFMPLLFLNIGIWGFSIGFTASFIALHFGFVGFIISVCLIMTQLLFMIPLVMFLSVTAIDYTLHNIKCQKVQRKINRKKMYVLSVCAFIILMIFSLPDIFVVPALIKTFSALI